MIAAPTRHHTLTIRVEAALVDRLKVCAEASPEGLSINQLVKRAILAELKRCEKGRATP